MLQKCPYCGELIFYREKGHSKEDRCDLRKKENEKKDDTETVEPSKAMNENQ